MGQKMYIKLSNTLPDVQPRFARGDASFTVYMLLICILYGFVLHEWKLKDKDKNWKRKKVIGGRFCTWVCACEAQT